MSVRRAGADTGHIAQPCDLRGSVLKSVASVVLPSTEMHVQITRVCARARRLLGRGFERNGESIQRAKGRFQKQTSSNAFPAGRGTVRRVITGAIEIERAQKRIGSSLEAHPIVHVSNEELYEAVVDCDLAEVCITSAATLVRDDGPTSAFRLPDVSGVAVVPNLAEGKKCARSWKILTNIGADPQFPDVSPRDAQALREWEATRKAAE